MRLAALLFATLATGCYVGWGGGSSGYYSNNAYRGYDSYPQADLNRSAFGRYAPAHEAWATSTRGRTSYGGGSVPNGEHAVVAHSGGHSGNTESGRAHGGSSAPDHQSPRTGKSNAINR